MNKLMNLNLNKLIYILIYIVLCLSVTIYFFLQGYDDLNSFLSFYNLFSGGVIWELFLGKISYNNIELLIFILINLGIFFTLISYLDKKRSNKYMYIFTTLLSLFLIFFGIILLSLGIWK